MKGKKIQVIPFILCADQLMLVPQQTAFEADQATHKIHQSQIAGVACLVIASLPMLGGIQLIHDPDYFLRNDRQFILQPCDQVLFHFPKFRGGERIGIEAIEELAGLNIERVLIFWHKAPEVKKKSRGEDDSFDVCI